MWNQTSYASSFQILNIFFRKKYCLILECAIQISCSSIRHSSLHKKLGWRVDIMGSRPKATCEKHINLNCKQRTKIHVLLNRVCIFKIFPSGVQYAGWSFSKVHIPAGLWMMQEHLLHLHHTSLNLLTRYQHSADYRPQQLHHQEYEQMELMVESLAKDQLYFLFQYCQQLQKMRALSVFGYSIT